MSNIKKNKQDENIGLEIFPVPLALREIKENIEINSTPTNITIR